MTGPWKRLAAFGAALLAVVPAARAIEEPPYAVVRTLPDIEIRRYPPYLVAEVLVPGPASSAGGQGFGILADYIFGKNQSQTKLEMTAPVSQLPVPAEAAEAAGTGARLALPAQGQAAQTPVPGGYLVQFVLPAATRLATAPTPSDARIHVRELPQQTVAVIRYSGWWSESGYQEHLDRLRAALLTAGLESEGEPVWSRYDPPFMPPWWRRNEIWLHLR